MKTKFMLLIALILLMGCASREREEGVAPGSTSKADEAVAKAEAIMASAGIALSFDELGSVSDLNEMLPDPLEIAQLEKSVIEESVASLYEALDELGDVTVPASPAPALEVRPSKSDLAMLHLHLAYLYVLEAVRRLMLVRGDMYTISFPEEPVTETLEVYRFELSPEAEERFKRLEEDPTTTPYDYLKQFTIAQRQAILDALVLLTGVEIYIEANPALGIPAQRPQVDRSIFRRDALYHLEKALGYAVGIAPALEEAFQEFKRTVQENFSYKLLEDARRWGFIVEEETLPEELRRRG
ncbi:hypothetical protein DRP77_10160 [Candidatus Poribacteria bacterium]|nr:MAG: hypothetical protein DRP77_10160 [Candidatus Poribacteria bacterium]